MVRLSVLLATNVHPSRLAQQAQQVEQAGLAGAWVPDHIGGGGNFSGPWWGALASLQAVLAATNTLPCGTLVASAVLRPAATLALETSSLRSMFWPRVVVGVGAGAQQDAAICGAAWPAPDRLQRYVQDFSGRAPDMPLVVAANTPRNVEVAAAARAGWVTTGRFGAVGTDKIKYLEVLRRTWDACPPAGPSMVLIDVPEPSPWRGPAAMADELARYSGLGFDEVVVFRPDCYAGSIGLSYQQAAELASPGIHELNRGIEKPLSLCGPTATGESVRS